MKVKTMRKRNKIGVLVLAVLFVFYVSSPFILFPVRLKTMSSANGSLESGTEYLFDVLAAPLLKALEGDNLYYNTWVEYSNSECSKYDVQCPEMLNAGQAVSGSAQE
jgi:hypothetical protein